jgi:glycosyltransferase involved in cell wall biosynthesis
MRLLYALRDQDLATTKSIGILHVSVAVLHGLVRQPEITRLDVLANRSLAPLVPAPPPHVRYHFLDAPAPRRWQRLWWDQWTLGAWTRRLEPDWLLLPKGFFPLLRRPAGRVSAYVHDNIFGHYARQGTNPFPWGEMTLFRHSLARTAAQADVIVTNSAFTAAEISSAYHCRAQPVPIGAPLLPAPAPARGSAELSADPRVLLLTSPHPHKLTARAIAWLQRLQAESRGPLAVVGVGGLPPGLAWPDQPGWQRHPRLSEEAFAGVRTGCNLLAYFSAYEGFGLPPLEALQAGLRVVASDLPPLRENLPAEILFANGSYDSFRQTVQRALAMATPPTTRTASPDDVAARWVTLLRESDAPGGR